MLSEPMNDIILQLASVSSQQSARVANLARDKRSRQVQTEFLIFGYLELPTPQFNILVRRRSRHCRKPTAVRQMKDGHVTRRQLAQGLRRQLHCSEQTDLRNFAQPDSIDDLLLVADFQHVAFQPDAVAL